MQRALTNLKASLTRVRNIAADIDANAQAALANAAVQARHETTLCASTVILSGFLESFLREVAEEMVTEICSKAVPFNDLPRKIRVTHYWDGGQRLTEVTRKERKERPLLLANASDVARRLASVASNQAPYEILWEAFADTQANPGSKEIGEFLGRFDVEKPIPTLAAAMSWSENTVVLRPTCSRLARNLRWSPRDPAKAAKRLPDPVCNPSLLPSPARGGTAFANHRAGHGSRRG